MTHKMLTVLILILFTTHLNETFALQPDPDIKVSGNAVIAQSAAEIPVLPHTLPNVSELARTSGSELQWWRIEQTHKMNFRRCLSRDGQTICEAPMLLNGLDEKDLPKFMAYYSERLQHWGSGHLTSLARVFTSSLGTATAYIGTFAALQVFKGDLPTSALNKFFASVPFRSGFHLLSVGSIGVLVYFTVNNLRHLILEKKLIREIAKVESGDFWKLPVDLNSHSLFEEFVSTFRRALYEYTHGGPPFDESDNLIFQ